jgi:formylglycine-generating enzyme
MTCCGPARPGQKGAAHQAAAPASPAPNASAPGAWSGQADLVDLPGGTFLMGTDDAEGFPADGEGPVREVTLAPFRISAYAVTNAQFAGFVAATGYVTGAERFGWSFVFAKFLRAELRRGAQRPASTPWWCRVDGATWDHPEGPGSGIDDRLGHPVVHIDHDDARAFCAWAGGRLPTEAEWEFAARGGLAQKRYPWGDELTPGGEQRCNIWRGRFPVYNDRDDGYLNTVPARSYRPNGYGLYCTSGNVWEWCADWWTARHPAGPQVSPRGPARGSARVMRGGSYLCHDSYCNRYRVAARTSNAPDSGNANQGFRVAADLP